VGCVVFLSVIQVDTEKERKKERKKERQITLAVFFWF
jgi:ribosomal protein S26